MSYRHLLVAAAAVARTGMGQRVGDADGDAEVDDDEDVEKNDGCSSSRSGSSIVRKLTGNRGMRTFDVKQGSSNRGSALPTICAVQSLLLSEWL